MARYEDGAVLCPFYKEESPSTLICEGPTPESTVRTTFTPKSKKLFYKLRYCGCDYKNCPLAYGLYRMWEEMDKEERSDGNCR